MSLIESKPRNTSVQMHQWCTDDQILKTKTKKHDQDLCLQDRHRNNKTKTTGSKQRHLADL